MFRPNYVSVMIENLQSLRIWGTKLHMLNKRLTGCSMESRHKLSDDLRLNEIDYVHLFLLRDGISLVVSLVLVNLVVTEQIETNAKLSSSFSLKSKGLKRGLLSMESSDYQMSEIGDSEDIDEESAKEWEHTLLQDPMDKELNELNKRLEEKGSTSLFINTILAI
ncbi:hypothetical protein ACH5RR_027484 [Cinchona calisaya]|uniref:Uncharacterized protein n=1 Tax=Cinchona calisaya TaxID=153742 RepID=A0ABD2Z5K0_9GENT